MKRRTLIATGGAALVASPLWSFSAMAQEATEAVPPVENEFGIPDMVMGAEDAPIEMIEYASFTCPHCARFHAEVYPLLKADYIDTGKVRFIYREVYFDRLGLWASMIARCGGPLRFFGIADMIYDKQSEWTASGDPAVIADELRKLGKTAGLTEEELDACLKDGEMAQNLVDWYTANAERDGIESTPTFIIDGEKNANMSYDDMKAILDAKL